MTSPWRAWTATAPPDRSFGRRGRTTIDAGGSEEAALALRPDGRIVVAGSTSVGRDMLVARLRRDGSLDPAFGGDGRATVDFAGSRDTALGLGLRGGRVVLAGSSDIQVAVARLLG